MIYRCYRGWEWGEWVTLLVKSVLLGVNLCARSKQPSGESNLRRPPFSHKAYKCSTCVAEGGHGQNNAKSPTNAWTMVFEVLDLVSV